MVGEWWFWLIWLAGFAVGWGVRGIRDGRRLQRILRAHEVWKQEKGIST
jgi:hypothetical protein